MRGRAPARRRQAPASRAAHAWHSERGIHSLCRLYHRKEAKERKHARKLQIKKNYSTIQVGHARAVPVPTPSSFPLIVFTQNVSPRIPRRVHVSCHCKCESTLAAQPMARDSMLSLCLFPLQEAVLLWERMRPKTATPEEKRQLATQVVKQVCL